MKTRHLVPTAGLGAPSEVEAPRAGGRKAERRRGVEVSQARAEAAA